MRITFPGPTGAPRSPAPVGGSIVANRLQSLESPCLPAIQKPYSRTLWTPGDERAAGITACFSGSGGTPSGLAELGQNLAGDGVFVPDAHLLADAAQTRIGRHEMGRLPLLCEGDDERVDYVVGALPGKLDR